MKNQIFISYRRNGGEALAQLINDRLRNLGYEVFYDIESLKSGSFNTKLYSEIEACEDFILILPPQALDRCIYDEDWIRCEVRHALKHNKNIIPIMMRGFTFPKNLPDDICEISNRNGVEFETMEYLNAKIEKITSMLISTPTATAYNPINSSEPALIQNVCSLCSCDFDNPFSKEGYYSEIINRDKYNVIYFHVSIAPIWDKDKITTRLLIFDSKNNMVFNDITEFNWSPEYDTVGLSWIIRGEDGSFVKSDTYKAVFRVDNSSTYEYFFKVFSENDSLLNPDKKSDDEIISKNKQRAKNLPNYAEKQKSHSIGLLLHFSYSANLFFLLMTYALGYWIIGLILSAVAIILLISLIKYTKKYVYSSLSVAIILCTLLHFVYGIYLLFSTITTTIQSFRSTPRSK